MTRFPFPDQFTLAEAAAIELWRQRYPDSFIASTAACWPIGRKYKDVRAYVARNPRRKDKAA